VLIRAVDELDIPSAGHNNVSRRNDESVVLATTVLQLNTVRANIASARLRLDVA